MGALINKKIILLKSKLSFTLATLVLYLPLLVFVQYMLYKSEMDFQMTFVMAVAIITLVWTEITNQFDTSGKAKRTLLSLPLTKKVFANSEYAWFFISFLVSVILTTLFLNGFSLITNRALFIPNALSFILALTVSFVMISIVMPLSQLLPVRVVNGIIGGVLGGTMGALSASSESIVVLLNNNKSNISVGLKYLTIATILLIASYIITRIILEKRDIK